MGHTPLFFSLFATALLVEIGAPECHQLIVVLVLLAQRWF
jgi:hypothetical protein